MCNVLKACSIVLACSIAKAGEGTAFLLRYATVALIGAQRIRSEGSDHECVLMGNS